MPVTITEGKEPAITALLNRAGTGLLSQIAFAESGMRPTLDFWHGYAKALTDLQCGAGAKLAAKDDALGGYQSPAFCRAAAGCLGVDLYGLTRAEIEQRLAQAGVKFALDPLAMGDAATTHVVEHIAVPAVDLHHKHAVVRVDLNDGAGSHAATLAQGGEA